MKITDEYIESLFEGTNFGEVINNSVKEQRKILKKSLGNQVKGYWSGHTIYQIMVYGGFLIDAKSSTKKRLTALGKEFISDKKEVCPYEEYPNRGFLHRRTTDPSLPKEKAFAYDWEHVNDPEKDLNHGNGLLQNLFISGFMCTEKLELEITPREKMITATAIQWLGSNVGFGFLENVLRTLNYRLTKIERW